MHGLNTAATLWCNRLSITLAGQLSLEPQVSGTSWQVDRSSADT
jgi:hypothetical protein